MMNETTLRLALAHLEQALQAMDTLATSTSSASQFVRRAETNLVYASQALEEAIGLAGRGAELVGAAA
jgi:hypothetical protein